MHRAQHGSLQLDKGKMQLRKADQGVPLAVLIHLGETDTAERVVRLPNNAQSCAETKGAERRETRRDTHAHPDILKCDGCRDAGRTWVQRSGPSDPPLPSSLSALVVRRPACRAPFVCLETIRSATMSKSISSSYAQWQGSTRWKQGWSVAWKGWHDSSGATSCRNRYLTSRQRRPLHAKQYHLQQTTVILSKGAHRKRSPNNQRQEQRATLLTRQRRPSLKHANGRKMRCASATRSATRRLRLRRRSTATSTTLLREPKRWRNT